MTGVLVDASAVPRVWGRGREWLIALAVAAGIAAAGLPLGLLWMKVSPKIHLIRVEHGAAYAEPTPEQFVADDACFIFIGLGAGLLSAFLIWGLVRRRRGPVLLAALTVGSVLAAVLAAWLGQKLGIAHYRELRDQTPIGQPLDGPALVRTSYVGLWWHVVPRVQGVVLAQPIAAALMYTLLAAFHPAPELTTTAPPPVWPWPLSDPPDSAVSSGWTAPQAPTAVPEPPVPGSAVPPHD